jgi:hypothetical protein
METEDGGEEEKALAALTLLDLVEVPRPCRHGVSDIIQKNARNTNGSSPISGKFLSPARGTRNVRIFSLTRPGSESYDERYPASRRSL